MLTQKQCTPNKLHTVYNIQHNISIIHRCH